MLPDVINPFNIDLAALEAYSADELAHQKRIVRARQYHEGEQPTFLTARAAEYLQIDDTELTFRLNAIRRVVTSVTDRLIVGGVDSANKELAAHAWAAWWVAGEMPGRQQKMHELAVRDGEAFLIVDWDESATPPRPRMLPHERYVSTEAGGDGFGVHMVYENDDPAQAPQYAVKFWQEVAAEGAVVRTYRRATVYHPERVERWRYGAGGWSLLETVPWVDGQGRPLGIPVVHFMNPDLRPEATDGLPLQNATNKGMIDLLAALDAAAFDRIFTLGFVPTTDGGAPKADESNVISAEPGAMISTTTTRTEADVVHVKGQDPTPLVNAVNQILLWLAAVTGTPISEFQFTKQVQSEGGQKEGQDALLARVEQRQMLFGAAWVRALSLCRRLDNFKGGGVWPEDDALVIIWRPAQKRAEADQREEWKAKREAGIPRSQLWREMGYTEEQIEQMEASPEHQARLALANMSMQANGDQEA